MTVQAKASDCPFFSLPFLPSLFVKGLSENARHPSSAEFVELGECFFAQAFCTRKLGLGKQRKGRS